MLPHDQRAGDRLEDPLRDRLDLLRAHEVTAGHDQLVAAEPGREVPAPELGTDPVRDLDEDGVALGVPERVVDLLEVVDVEVQQRHERPGPGRPGQREVEVVQEVGAVGQPGQRVVQGPVHQGRLGLLAQGDVLRLGGQVQHGSVRVPHRRGGHARPDGRAVGTQVALLHDRAGALAGEHGPEDVEAGVDVLRMGDLGERDATHLLGCAAHQLAHRRIDLEERAGPRHRTDRDQDHADRRVAEGLSEPLLDGDQPPLLLLGDPLVGQVTDGHEHGALVPPADRGVAHLGGHTPTSGPGRLLHRRLRDAGVADLRQPREDRARRGRVDQGREADAPQVRPVGEGRPGHGVGREDGAVGDAQDDHGAGAGLREGVEAGVGLREEIPVGQPLPPCVTPPARPGSRTVRHPWHDSGAASGPQRLAPTSTRTAQTSTWVSGIEESTGRSRAEAGIPRRSTAAPSAAIIAPLSVQ